MKNQNEPSVATLDKDLKEFRKEMDTRFNRLAFAVVKNTSDIAELVPAVKSLSENMNLLVSWSDSFSHKVDVYWKKELVHDHRLNELETKVEGHDKRLISLETKQ